MTADIEVSREHDENANHDYDREDDHYVDPRLMGHGVEYLGQPSVVHKVSFDPRSEGFVGATEYAGYGDWNGVSGTLHPPDATISADNGRGADRLRVVQLNGETFRWGVYSYGSEGGGGTTTEASPTATAGRAAATRRPAGRAAAARGSASRGRRWRRSPT